MIPVFPNILFIILIAILTGYLTFLTTKGNLTDNRKKGTWKKFTSRGKKVFIVLLLILLTLISQEWNNIKSSKLKELQIKRERSKRDSIIEKRISYATDSISKKYYENIATAFSKQEFELDTLNETIIKLRTNSIDIAKQQASPVLILDSKALKLKQKTNNISKYSLNIKIRDAGATNFNIKCKTLSRYTDDFYSLNVVDIFPKGMRMAKDSEWKTGFTSINLTNNLEIKSIYLNIIGTYTTLDGLKSYKINDIYEYRISDSTFAMPKNDYQEELKTLFKEIPDNGYLKKAKLSKEYN